MLNCKVNESLTGGIIFQAQEHWSFPAALYFSFITLMTVGFGDFVPGIVILLITNVCT